LVGSNTDRVSLAELLPRQLKLMNQESLAWARRECPKNLGRQGLPNHNYLLGRVGSGRTAIDHLID
jgi:hypothetical protein